MIVTPTQLLAGLETPRAKEGARATDNPVQPRATRHQSLLVSSFLCASSRRRRDTENNPPRRARPRRRAADDVTVGPDEREEEEKQGEKPAVEFAVEGKKESRLGGRAHCNRP